MSQNSSHGDSVVRTTNHAVREEEKIGRMLSELSWQAQEEWAEDAKRTDKDSLYALYSQLVEYDERHPGKLNPMVRAILAVRKMQYELAERSAGCGLRKGWYLI